MKRIILLLGAMLVCLPAVAQTVTLESNTNLHERPNVTSSVKMSLPAGIQLSVLSEQEGWLAVSTSTGIVGWIQKPAAGPAPSDDLDDLLRSIDEAGQAAPPTPTPGPTPAPTPTPTPTPPPAPTPTPTATPTPAPAPTPNVGAPPPPPPPSARPPSQGGTSFGQAPPTDAPLTDLIGGFYDKYQWISAAVDLKKYYKGIKFDYTKMLGSFGQLGGWLSAIDGGGYPHIKPEDFGDFGNFFGKGTAVATCDCEVDITTVSGGIMLGAFPIQPTASSPLGADVSVRLGGGTFSGDDVQSGIAKAVLAGEVGVFYKIGSSNSPQFMPRASVQMIRDELICTGEAKDGFACGINDSGDARDNIGATVTNIFLSLEMNYHGLVPGVHLTLLESPEEDKSFNTLFGFSFTYAH